MVVAHLLAAVALTASPEHVIAVQVDYAQQKATGSDCRYVDLAAVPESVNGLAVVQFVSVLASREPLLDDQIPQMLPGTSMARLRLNRLQWDGNDWVEIFGAGHSPYTLQANPLIIPAGAFVYAIADSTKSDAYQRLYFGGTKKPKTLAEFLSALGIDPKKQRGLAQGVVEGKSRVNVAVNGTRMIRHDDGIHSEAWTTFDVRDVKDGSDPLEALTDDRLKPDGSEVFVLAPKVHTSGVRGVFPVTALANGAGQLVNEAPVNLVQDSTHFAGQTAIVNPGSCAQCHRGPQKLTLNALRDRLSAGVELLTSDEARRVQIELFHLGELDSGLARWMDGYTAALAAVNGLSPDENAAEFKAFIDFYLSPVDLDQAAKELSATPAELRLALAWASAERIDIGNRLAGLAHKRDMPRSAWDNANLKAVALLSRWRSKK